MNVLAIVVLISVVAPFVVYSMPAVVGADHSFVVLSGSMEPEISPGDVVIVGETPPEQIERGDVITFVRAEAEVPTTHRVIEVNQREDGVAYTTKGDANEDPDPAPVRGSELIGEVTYVIPLIGYVVRFANTQTGFLLLIGLPLGLLVANEAWSILRSGDDEISPNRSDEATGPTDPAGSTASGVTAAASTTAATSESHPEQTDGATDGESSQDGSSTYTITRSDLRLSMTILFVFAGYATWVALQDTSGVTVTAAVGSGAGAIICGAIYYAAGGEGDSSPPPDPGTDVDGDGGGDQDHPDDGDDGAAGQRVATEASTDHEHAESAPTASGDDSPSSIERPAAHTSKRSGPDGVTTADDEAGTTHGSEATNGTGGADESARTGETPEPTDRGEEP